MAHKVTDIIKVNVCASDMGEASAFFEGVLGAELVHDRGSDTIGDFAGRHDVAHLAPGHGEEDEEVGQRAQDSGLEHGELLPIRHGNGSRQSHRRLERKAGRSGHLEPRAFRVRDRRSL